MLYDKTEGTEVEMIEDPIPEPEEKGSVTVDLDKKPEKAGAKAEPKTPIEDSEEKKELARLGYKLRQQERQIKEYENVIRSQPPAEPKPAKKEGEVDYDELAQQDWKKAVKLLGREAATEIFQELYQRLQVQSQEQRFQEMQEASKKKVIEQYPNLEDESTEEARIFMQVVSEDSSLQSNPHGPEIAMYRMREKLQAGGRLPDPVRREVSSQVNQEMQRQLRARAGSVPLGRTGPRDNKVMLTKEQQAFCDRHNIPYDQYAKNVRALETEQSVEA